MKLRQGIRIFALGKMKHLLELHRVAALLPGFARIRTLAQLAINDADVGVIDVTIDVVVGVVAVEPLANLIREPSDSDDVVGFVELDAFLKREPLTAMNFLRNSLHAEKIIHDRIAVGALYEA